jgi:hypothetical protein
MSRLRVSLVGLLLLAGLCAPAAEAQRLSASSSPPDSTVEVMVLGSMHFANPGQDSFNPRVGDVTTPERQAQIRAVIDSLMDFRPTAVAVEWPRRDAAALDSLFRAYRAGRHDLAPNERQQLGFRLAARSDHDRIYAVDRQHPFPIDTVLSYARTHDPAFVRYYQRYGKALTARLDSVGQEAPIGGMLRFVNDPRFVEALYAPYLRMPEVGADSSHVGVRPVAAYYERNLHIFANLTAAVEPGDRAIVLFGAGHSAFLRQFVDGHPQMRLVEPLDYL